MSTGGDLHAVEHIDHEVSYQLSRLFLVFRFEVDFVHHRLGQPKLRCRTSGRQACTLALRLSCWSKEAFSMQRLAHPWVALVTGRLLRCHLGLSVENERAPISFFVSFSRAFLLVFV